MSRDTGDGGFSQDGVLDVAAAPQLNYSLGNPEAPGTIFVSSKASDNQPGHVLDGGGELYRGDFGAAGPGDDRNRLALTPTINDE